MAHLQVDSAEGYRSYKDRAIMQARAEESLRRIRKAAIIENMSLEEDRLNRLEAQIRDQAQIIDKLQNMLRIAANYKNDDIREQVAGLQAALLKAGEVKARDGGRRR